MLGLISRLRRGQAHTAVRVPTKAEVLDARIAERRRLRLAKPPRTEKARFDRARPMTELLRRELSDGKAGLKRPASPFQA